MTGKVAINQAKNAALLAIQILGTHDEAVAAKLEHYRRNMRDSVLGSEL